MLLIRSVNFPDNKMKGIVNNEGSEDNSCMSNSEECGNIVDICPKIGETAKPGSAFKAEIDHIPKSVIKRYSPLSSFYFHNHIFFMLAFSKTIITFECLPVLF